MFGNASFAEVPVAALRSTGGAVFLMSISENINIADANSQVFVFNEAVFENVVMDDIDKTVNSVKTHKFAELAGAIAFTREKELIWKFIEKQ
jgi:hypothetical protein